jgi:hypothetical protein
MAGIVTNRPPRRNRPKTQPVEIKAPRIVQHTPRWKREPKPLPPDPERDAQIAAFFARMGLKLPPEE